MVGHRDEREARLLRPLRMRHQLARSVLLTASVQPISISVMGVRYGRSGGDDKQRTTAAPHAGRAQLSVRDPVMPILV